MPIDPKPAPERRDDRPLSSPYGPQHGHVDAAAGGADSSQSENESSGEGATVAADPGKEPPAR